MAMLYLQDIFWLSASRINVLTNGSALYKIAPFAWSTFSLFCLLAIFFTILSIITALVTRPITKLSVNNKVLFGIIVVAMIANLAAFAYIGSRARYTSGGLTGVAGLIYGISSALSVGAMILVLRVRNIQRLSPSYSWIAALLICTAINIDGLAGALTIMMFILLLFPRPSLKGMLVLILLGSGLLFIGLSAKWSEWPQYITAEFLARWGIARFSIQAESMFTYLSDASIIHGSWDYFAIVSRSIGDRIELVFGTPFSFIYPRSISEALYFDATGEFGGGSSPGILLGTALQGPILFVVVPILFSMIFFQMLYGMDRRLTAVELLSYPFFLKLFHTNVSELLTVISPTLFAMFVLLGVCLINLRQPRMIN